MTIRESIIEYLTRKGEGTAAPISQEIGASRKSVHKTLTRMADCGLVSQAEDGSFTLTDAATKPGPEAPKQDPKRRDVMWSPGVEYDNNGGELRTVPTEDTADPDEEGLFEQFGLDPAKWKITNLRRSTWQTYDERWLHAYRGSFSPRVGSQALGEITDEALTDILSRYHAYHVPRPRPHSVFMIPVGDTQLGKPDGGGSAATVARFAAMTDQAGQKILANGCQRLILPWLGDCLEGVVSQGGRNVATLDLSITEQVRVFRRLFLHQIATLAPLADEVIIPVVGGNHDEAMRDQNMGVHDSWAIEAAAAVQDALVLSEKFDHVRFVFPDRTNLGVTMDVMAGLDADPYVIHFEHGHAARNPNKVIDWWKGQTHGRQPAGAADMLITAHFHTTKVTATGGDRWWIQTPNMDGGSDWFRRGTGEDSSAGMMSMRVVGGAQGWADMEVHGG